MQLLLLLIMRLLVVDWLRAGLLACGLILNSSGRPDVVVGGKRLGCHQNGRTSMIDRRKVGAVLLGGLRVLQLGRHGRVVLFVIRGHFRGARLGLITARAVVADARAVVDDGVVVDAAHYRGVHVVDRAVVSKAVAVPVATLVAEAYVAEAIVDAPVVADVATPISAVVAIASAIVVVSPVPGRPQRSLIGGIDPRTGNPIVVIGSIVPVAGGPDVAITGAGWLFILRQWRRRLLRVGHWLVIRTVVGRVGRVLTRAVLIGRILIVVVRWILIGRRSRRATLRSRSLTGRRCALILIGRLILAGVLTRCVRDRRHIGRSRVLGWVL